MTRDPLKLVVSLTIFFAIPTKKAKPIIADHNYSQDLHAVHPVACATTLKKGPFSHKDNRSPSLVSQWYVSRTPSSRCQHSE